MTANKHRLRLLCLGAVLALALAACAPSSGNNAAPAAPVAPAPTAAAPAVTQPAPPAPTTAAPTLAATAAAATGGAPGVAAGAGQFENPVLASDFADPDVIQVGNTFYAYATNAAGKNIQAARSTDMIHWELLSDALPALPLWAQPGGSLVWAPGVIQLGNQFVMYYTARDLQSNKQCIGVAVAAKPDGHFKDTTDKPLVCQADQGGSIDPQPFADGGKLYLDWKNDGNCCGMTTYLYAQELSADGLKLTGQPMTLTQTSQNWEGRLIEAPFMFKHNTTYYLFFSANDYASPAYAVGYATCQSPLGPCQQAPESENPILKSRMTTPLVIGPGGQSLLQVGGQTWIFYHAWNIVAGTRGDARYMWLDRLNWQNDKPVVAGPTTSPQPGP